MYNNPYNYYPYMNTMQVRPKPSLFRSLSGIKWETILNNTQKTLNVINQAIPVYYQIKPIFSNLKSFGKLVSAFNEEDSKNNNIETIKKENSHNPTFFIPST